MIIRELVTLLTYKVVGQEAAEAGMDRLTERALRLAEIFGIVYGLEEIKDLADEWNTIAGRIGIVTNGVQEQQQVMKGLQKIAEDTGSSFESLGNLFVNFKASTKNLDDGKILRMIQTASEVIQQGAINIGHVHRTVMQLDEIMSTGVFNKAHLRELAIDNPALVSFMANQLGGRDKLFEMVEKHKFTKDTLIKILTDGAELADSQFKTLGETFSRATGQIRNMFGGMIYEIQESTHVFTIMARAMVDGFRWIRNEIEDIVTAVGGWSNALELLGIVAAAVFMRQIVGGLMAVFTWLRRVLVTEALATAEFWLIAAAIVAAGLAMQDLWVWVHGGNSLIGRYIGSFREWIPYIREARDWVSRIVTSFLAMHHVVSLINSSLSLARNFVAFITHAFETLVNYDWAKQFGALGDTFKKAFGGDGGTLTAIFNGVLTVLTTIVRTLSSMFKLLNQGGQKDWWFKTLLDDTFLVLQKIIEGTGAFTNAIGWVFNHIPNMAMSGTDPLGDPGAGSLLTNPSGGVTYNNGHTVSVVNSTTVNAPNSNGSTVAAAANKGVGRGTSDALARQLNVSIPTAEAGTGN